MANQLYKQVSITVGAGSEDTVAGLTSREDERYRVVSVTLASVATNTLILKHEREELARIASDVRPMTQDWLGVDLDLPVGETLYVGIANSAGAPATAIITIRYEVV